MPSWHDHPRLARALPPARADAVRGHARLSGADRGPRSPGEGLPDRHGGRGPGARRPRRIARFKAGAPRGPLDGVPIAVKDVLCTRGIRTTCGSKILEHFVPPYDATAVDAAARRRARCCSASSTWTSSPWARPPRTPASSPRATPGISRACPAARRGGSAAAVAADMAAAALGTDTGGSIRQPARVLRRRRAQADLRSRLALRAHRLRVVARPDRPARQGRGGRGAHAPGHRRPRSAGLDVGRRAGAGLPGRSWRTASRGSGSAFPPSTSSRGWTRRWRRPCAPRSRCSRSWARGASRCRCRTPSTESPRTT